LSKLGITEWNSAVWRRFERRLSLKTCSL